MSKLKGYATSTGTLKNLEYLKNINWGLVVTPDRVETQNFKSYFIDNGAWSAYSKGLNWKKYYEKRFKLLCDASGEKADFIVSPDIVAGGKHSLSLSLDYIEYLETYETMILIPVQDGMEPCSELYSVLSPTIGLFVGGTTKWKLKSLTLWSWLAKRTNCYLHVARVNTCKRLRYCAEFKINSFDGSRLSRYSDDAKLLNDCRLRLIEKFYG